MSKNKKPTDSQLVPFNDPQDVEMGKQLTEQYHRATGAMREVLIFGAMMLMVRERIDSTRGADPDKPGRKGAKYAKNTGIKAWLAEYAPEVKESTAYRFMHVAEAVSKEFPLPPKIAKQIDFAHLATCEPEKLPEPARKSQQLLFDFVAGTSQRSWLDRFNPPAPKGGKREGAGKKNLAKDNEQESAIDLWTPILKGLAIEGLQEKSWIHLPDTGEVSRETLKGLLVDLNKLISSKPAKSSEPEETEDAEA